MAHDHRHLSQHPEPADDGTARRGDRRLVAAIAINLALTALELAGGIVSGSLALIADAVHNLSDVAALGLALWARRLARRPADGTMTFGWGRAELVAALVNLVALLMLVVWLGAEAVSRLLDPPPIAGTMMMAVAGIALAIDGATAALTAAMARGSVNIRAAFLHNLLDAAGSIAVMVGAGAVILFDWRWADPLVTLALAALMGWLALRELPPVLRMLMLAAGPGMDAHVIARTLAGEPGVASVHHLHLWQLSERGHSLEAHVVLTPEGMADPQAVRRRLRQKLAERFGITHATLEFEDEASACPVQSEVGGRLGAEGGGAH